MASSARPVLFRSFSPKSLNFYLGYTLANEKKGKEEEKRHNKASLKFDFFSPRLFMKFRNEISINTTAFKCSSLTPLHERICDRIFNFLLTVTIHVAPQIVQIFIRNYTKCYMRLAKCRVIDERLHWPIDEYLSPLCSSRRRTELRLLSLRSPFRYNIFPPLSQKPHARLLRSFVLA